MQIYGLDEHFFVYRFIKYFNMYGLGISLLLGWMIHKYKKNTFFAQTDNCVQFAFLFSYSVSILVGAAYVLYPNYLDHLEPTVASLGLIFKQGLSIYPALDEYTFHGLIYGPLLSEIQAIFQYFPFDAITNSKLPGFLSLLGVFAIAVRFFHTNLARGYLLILLPFGAFIFWTRAEPLFLLLCMLSWVVTRGHGNLKWLVLGVIAGCASAIKLHGFMYVLPYVCMAWILNPCRGIKCFTLSCALLIVGGILSTLVCYGPDPVSVGNFISLLRMASHHGVVYVLVEKNIVFGVLLLLPIWQIFRKGELSSNEKIAVGLITLNMAAVAFIGGKVGSGIHHMMPFILSNAAMIEIVMRDKELKNFEFYKYAFLIISVYFIFSVIPKSVQNEIRNYQPSSQLEAKDELLQFAQRYPNLLMAPTDEKRLPYSFTYLRVHLQAQNTLQLDTAAFMDLNYAGVTDQPLTNAITNCQRPFVVTPREGLAFSILNPYTSEPLFSDTTRNSFSQKYLKIEQGKFFDVFGCKPS